jgi:hypothetical protein
LKSAPQKKKKKKEKFQQDEEEQVRTCDILGNLDEKEIENDLLGVFVDEERGRVQIEQCHVQNFPQVHVNFFWFFQANFHEKDHTQILPRNLFGPCFWWQQFIHVPFFFPGKLQKKNKPKSQREVNEGFVCLFLRLFFFLAGISEFGKVH